MTVFPKTWSKVLVGAAIAAIVLLSGSGAATADHGWGLLLSYWGTQDASDGPGLGAKFSFELLPWVLWDFRGTWYEDLGSDGLELQVVPWETGISFVGSGSENFQYFGGLGGGYYSFDATAIASPTQSTSLDLDSEIGFYGNAGIEYTVSRQVESIGAKRATVFLEFMYRAVEVKQLNVAGTSVRGNLSLAGPSANLGFMLRW